MSNTQAALLPATTELKPVIQLGTDAIAIGELAKKYSDIVPIDTKTFDDLKKGIAVFRELRGTVTDMHAEKKRPILDAGNALDAEKTKLLQLIKEAETPLVNKKIAYEAEKEKIKAAKAAAEKARVDKIQAKITAFGGYLIGVQNKTVLVLQSDISFFDSCMKADSFDYEEFTASADSMKLSTKKALEDALKSRVAFEEEQAKVAAERLKLEEERAAMEKQRLEQEAEQKRLAAIEAEKIKAQYDALEKAKADQEQKRKEDAAAMAAELKKLDEAKQAAQEPGSFIAYKVSDGSPIIRHMHGTSGKPDFIGRVVEAQVLTTQLTIESLADSEQFRAGVLGASLELFEALKTIFESGILREGSVLYKQAETAINKALKKE